MVFFHRHAPTPASPPMASSKRNSAMLEARLQDLQDTLCSRTSKFHVQVSVPTHGGHPNYSRLSSQHNHHRHHPDKCHSCIPVQNEQDLPHRQGLSERPLKHVSDRISSLNPYRSPPLPSSSSACLSSSVPATSNALHGQYSSATHHNAAPPIDHSSHGYDAKPNSDYIESPAVSRIRSKIGLNVYHNLSLMHNRLQNLPSLNAQQKESSGSRNPEQDEEYNQTAVSRLDILRDQHSRPSKAPARINGVCDSNGDGDTDSDSDVSVSAISWKLSALKDDIESFSRGHEAPSKQLDVLRQRHESTRASIQSLEEGQVSLRDKILNLEQRTRERDKWLEMVKLDRMRTISDSVKAADLRTSMDHSNHIGKWPAHTTDQEMMMMRSSGCHGSSSSEGSEMMRITEFWAENNCDFHVNKIIHSLRKLAAYEILEFCHNRLSRHMIGHICGALQELGTGEKRASYLRMLGLPERLKGEDQEEEEDCRGRLAALSLQMTYAELLGFVDQQMRAGKRVKKELFAALKAAETGMLDDAERESYDRELVGDIRWQMAGFKLLQSAFRNTRYDQSMAKFQKLEETKDIVADVMKTIEEGNLGALERCAKLIRLGCYFLERQRLLNPPSAAQELDSLNLDADFDDQ